MRLVSQNSVVKPATEAPTKKKLLDEVRDLIRVKHYSLRTEQAYVQWIRRYILFHGKRHPREMGRQEIEAFLTHLAVKGESVSFYAKSGIQCAVV